jgi:hypothetical protein
VSGGFLPIISLTFLDMLISYITKSKSKSNENNDDEYEYEYVTVDKYGNEIQIDETEEIITPLDQTEVTSVENKKKDQPIVIEAQTKNQQIEEPIIEKLASENIITQEILMSDRVDESVKNTFQEEVEIVKPPTRLESIESTTRNIEETISLDELTSILGKFLQMNKVTNTPNSENLLNLEMANSGIALDSLFTTDLNPQTSITLDNHTPSNEPTSHIKQNDVLPLSSEAKPLINTPKQEHQDNRIEPSNDIENTNSSVSIGQEFKAPHRVQNTHLET